MRFYGRLLYLKEIPHTCRKEKKMHGSHQLMLAMMNNTAMNRKRITRSTGSSTASKNNANKENRGHRRRHSTTCTIHEPETLGNLFEIEDAKYLVTQSGPNTEFSSCKR